MSLKEVEQKIHNFAMEMYHIGYEEGDSNQRENSCYQYEQGIEDAWKYIKLLVLDSDKGGMPRSVYKDIFGSVSFQDVLQSYTPFEIIKKIEDYELKHDTYSKSNYESYKNQLSNLKSKSCDTCGTENCNPKDCLTALYTLHWTPKKGQ